MTAAGRDRAPRRIPIALWQGAIDAVVPPLLARRTEATLIAHGFPAHLTEINGHGHNYYDRSNQINEAVRTFLQKQQLTSDPIYQQHRFAR